MNRCIDNAVIKDKPIRRIDIDIIFVTEVALPILLSPQCIGVSGIACGGDFSMQNFPMG